MSLTTNGVGAFADRWEPATRRTARTVVEDDATSATTAAPPGAPPSTTRDHTVQRVSAPQRDNLQRDGDGVETVEGEPTPTAKVAETHQSELDDLHRAVAESRRGSESMAATATPATPARDDAPVAVAKFGTPAPVAAGSFIDRLV